jgi:predicted nucleotidyltransferase
MVKQIKELLVELKKGLSDIYGLRLEGVYLFGSYARNEEDEESDIDVLIILDRIDNYSEEVDRTSALLSEISLAHGCSISCVFSTDEHFERSDTMFFLNVREEAIPA